MRQEFGGPWTVLKLDCVRKYLTAYVKVMKHQVFTTYYVDAFAGTGYVELKTEFSQDPAASEAIDELERESRRMLQGSAAQALEITPPFDRYVFIESSEWRVQQLEGLRRRHFHLWGSIDIRHGDANTQIRRLCEQWNPRSDRGVIFLDPFGMAVEWTTLEAIAGTRSLDLWYLVPISTVYRLLPREGEVAHEGWRRRLRLFFGTDTWESTLYQRRTERNLFEEYERVERVADWE